MVDEGIDVEERWARYDRERIEARTRHDLDEHPAPMFVPGCYRCRDRREEPRREVARLQAIDDERQMDWCRMRDSSVRRLPLSRTHGRKCYLCGKVLANEADIKAPRRRRWCSDACSTLWWQNHAWSSASAERVRLDNHACVRCGTGRDTARTVCGRCETIWPCETARLYGSGEELRMPGHWPTKSWMALEVNHKDPRVGRGYGNGCHHHLDRLETLCHDCHVIETNRQAAERRAARIAKTGEQLGLPVDGMLQPGIGSGPVSLTPPEG